jgi:hypothetical protein
MTGTSRAAAIVDVDRSGCKDDRNTGGPSSQYKHRDPQEGLRALGFPRRNDQVGFVADCRAEHAYPIPADGAGAFGERAGTG